MVRHAAARCWWWMLAVGVASACASGGAGDSPAAAIRLEAVRGDAVSIVEANGGVRVEVDRQRGIGGATLHLAAGTWPERLRLDLVGFRNLESLVVCRDALCLETDLRRAPAVSTREGELDQAGLAAIQIPIRADAGSIVVDLPAAALARGATSLALRWVDEFR
jgi:hypothetical protein